MNDTQTRSRKSGAAKASPASRAKAAVASLKRLGTKSVRDGMARYAIPSDKAFGVPMNQVQKLGKSLGKDHDLAEALWTTGWYEARLLAAYVDEPERVTPTQMDRWCKGFDNWAVPDTVCFVLFDRTPHAFARIEKWSRRKDEFGKRAAFALLASVALHDKTSDDAAFLRCLPLIEGAADDGRNFVKKGVSWALRSVGKRNRALRAAALALAEKLSASTEPAARWVGKDALRDLRRG